MERLSKALQALVDEEYGVWGGVSDSLREAVAAFHEITNVYPVVIPDDAD